MSCCLLDCVLHCHMHGKPGQLVLYRGAANVGSGRPYDSMVVPGKKEDLCATYSAR